MRVERLEVAGYKHLNGLFVFGPRITVVTGPNESGKSTLHGALENGLFGFSSADRRQRGGSSPKDLCRPWDGAPFRVVVAFVDTSGRTIRMDWDFDQDTVDVHDVVIGQRLLHEQPTQRQDFTVGPTFLGMEREEHHQLSCLFQEGLSPVRPSENLRQALQRAVEATPANERGVEEADDRLRDLLSTIGVQSNHYGALAGGRLRSLEHQITELEGQLDAARVGRAELDALAADQAAQAALLARVMKHEGAARQATLRADAVALAAAVREAEGLEARAGAAAVGRTMLPADLPGRVASARDALRDARDQEAVAADAVAGTDVQEVQTRQRAADAELEALAAYAAVSTDAEERVREDLGTLTGAWALAAPPSAPPDRDPRLDRFRRSHSWSDQPTQATEVAARSSRLTNAAVALGLAGVVAGIAVHPAAFALVVIGVVVLIAGRARATAAEHAAVPDFEGRPVTELAEAAAAEDRIWIAYEAARAEHERLAREGAERRDVAEARLRTTLDEVLTGPGTPIERANAYLQQCVRHRAWIDARGRSEQLAAELRTASEPQRQFRTAREMAERAEAELRRLLAQAGVRDDDLAAGLDAFGALVQAETDQREDAERLATAAGRLEQLLAGRNSDELRSQARQAQDALEEHERVHGVLSSDDLRPDAERSLADERTRIAAVVADLAARRDEREAGLGDPADLELQLHGLRTELADVRFRRDAVRTAREELQESAREAHRRVAPHLNAALARELPRITRGRYREAMVDDDLTIRVVAPGTGGIADVELLSRGTRDQIALVQRLELARLLDPTGGGAPLLLDDCFAHTDTFRLPLVIDLLAEVAAHRQVILFSHDSDVIDAVRNAEPEAAVIDLPDPVRE
jgi:hypothetical protein